MVGPLKPLEPLSGQDRLPLENRLQGAIDRRKREVGASPQRFDIGEFFQNRARNEVFRLNLSLDEGAKISADQVARVVRLEHQTGLPPNLIASNLDALEEDVRRRSFNAEKFRKSSPIVAKWIQQSPFYAGQSIKDIINTGRMEEILTRPKTLWRMDAAMKDRLSERLATAEQTRRAGKFDLEGMGFALAEGETVEEALEKWNEFQFQKLKTKFLGELEDEESFIASDDPVGGFEALGNRFRENPVFLAPYLGTAADVVKVVELYEAAKAVENGQDTQVDRDLMARYGRLAMATERRGTTIFGDTAGILAEAPAFITEFAATQGVYGATKGAIMKSGKEFAERTLKNAARKVLRGKAIGVLGGVTAQTVVGSPLRIAKETLELMTPATRAAIENGDLVTKITPGTGKAFWVALPQAVVSSWAEMASERVGSTALFKLLDKKVNRLLFESWAGKFKGRTVEAFRKGLEAGGVNGIIGEMTEERIADLIRMVGPGVKFNLPDVLPAPIGNISARQLGAEALAFGLMQAPGQAISPWGRREERQNPEIMKQIGDLMVQLDQQQDLREKRQVVLREVVQSSENEFIFTDIDKWDSYWQDKKDEQGRPLTAEAIAAELTGDPGAYQRAKDQNADLVIPMERYATKFSGTEHNTFFQDSGRVRPEEITAEEAEARQEEVDEAEARIRGEAAPLEASAIKVQEVVSTQLEKTGKFTPRDVQVLSNFAASGFRALARRRGIDPFTLLERRRLVIQAEAQTGVSPNEPVGEDTRQVTKPEDLPEAQQQTLDALQGIGAEGGTAVQVGQKAKIERPIDTDLEALVKAGLAESTAEIRDGRESLVFRPKPQPEGVAQVGEAGPAFRAAAAAEAKGERAPIIGEEVAEATQALSDRLQNGTILVDAEGNRWKVQVGRKGNITLVSVNEKGEETGNVIDIKDEKGKFNPKGIQRLATMQVAEAPAAKKPDRGVPGEAANIIKLQQENRGSITFSTGQAIIRLLETSNESTFLHELGHFFLETLGDFAADPAAPVALKRDMDTVRAWWKENAATIRVDAKQAKPYEIDQVGKKFIVFGPRGRRETFSSRQKAQNRKNKLEASFKASINKLPISAFDEIADNFQTMQNTDAREVLRREMSEQFARGFEAYLRKGKAPTAGLRRAFARFAEWLTRIYKSILDLRVNLSPEVEAVMDRMLATEEEISAVETEQDLRPLEEDIRDLGFSEKQAEDQAKMIADARAANREGLRTKLMEVLERRKEIKEGKRREEIEADVENQVNARPEYIALANMQKGQNADGSDLPADKPAVKLQRQDIVDLVGSTDILKLLPRGIVEEEGTDPDTASREFGYGGGNELLDAMAKIEPKQKLIDRLVDDRIRIEVPDPADDPAEMTRLVNEAIHNKDVAQMARNDMKLITSTQFAKRNKLSERINRPVPRVEAVTLNAQRTIAKLTWRQIHAGIYHRAEVKARKRARKMFDAGNFEGAFDLKQQELVNHELFLAAKEAREEYDRTVDFANEFNKKTVQALIGKAGSSYMEQAADIMGRFDFKRNVSLRQLGKRASLRAWIEERQKEDNFTPQISERLMNEAFSTHWKDLTFTQLQEVRDALQSIRHMATFKNKLLLDAKNRKFDEARDAAVAHMEEVHPKKRKAPIGEETTAMGLLRTGSAFLTMQRTFSSLARQLDGGVDGGPMWELLIRNGNNAADNEASKTDALMRTFIKNFETAYTLKDRAKMSLKKKMPEIKASLTKFDLLAVAFNVGNPGNRGVLQRGYRWSDQALESLLNRLDERDWKFVQSVWDLVDSLWPEIAEIHRRVNGTVPEKVKAAPVVTKFGTFRGGYYPLKYDRRADRTGRIQDAKVAADAAFRGAAITNTTQHGFTEERKKNVNRKVLLQFDTLFTHLQEAIHHLTHYEYLIDANKVLRDGDIERTIKERHGDLVYDEMTLALQDIATGPMAARNAAEKIANFLRRGTAVSILGWKVGTALMQPLGVTNSMVRLGDGNVIEGGKWLMKGYARWFGDATRMENTVRWIQERSQFMKTRSRTQTREINDARNELRIRGKFTGPAIDSAYFMMIKAQLGADVPTWIGAYLKSTAEQSLEKASTPEQREAIEEKASRIADQTVRDSQGSGLVIDQARILRGSPYLKLFTMFLSYFNRTFNLASESVARTKLTPSSAGALAADFLMLYIIPATLGFAMKRVLRGPDEDEDIPADLARENAAYILGSLVFVRELSSPVLGYQYKGPAGTRLFQDVGNLFIQTSQGEFDEGFWRASLRTSGALFHLPSGQVEQTIRGYNAYIEGETDVPTAVLLGPPSKRR